MQSDPPRSWRASVHRNDKFILIATVSGYRSSILDYQGVAHHLDLKASDEQLGQALADAMQYSRFVLPEEDPELYDYERLRERYSSWWKGLMRRYRYTSRRNLLKDMMYCLSERVGGEISFRPFRHAATQEWHGLPDESTVRVSAKSSAGEIGAVLRLALDRCV
jgi:hypothetical protein